MQQEATTSDSAVETTQEVATEASEPQTETSTTETGTADRADDSTGANAGPDFPAHSVSFDNIPEEHRSLLEQKQKEIDLHFKREMTRMRQEDKAQGRLTQTKLEEYERQNQELVRVAREVLTDPSKLELYRQQLGPQLGVNSPAQAPQIENIEDLVKYTQQNAEQVATQKVQKEVQALRMERQQDRMQNQYNSAVTKLKTEDPMFNQFEKHVAAIVKQPEYQKLYDGSNEYEVLNLAYSDLKNIFTPQLEKVKEDTLSSLKKKKSSTTFSPQATVATEGKVTGRSKDDIIAEVNAKLGPPLKGIGTVTSRK